MTEGLIVENGIVTGYTGMSADVVIDGDVTSIADKAFMNNTLVKYVNITSDLTGIEESAFEGCTALERLDISMVKRIGSRAFYGCCNLKSMELPNGTMEIGDRAFLECPELYYISIPASVLMIGTNIVNNKRFENCQTVMVVSHGSAAHDYAVKNGLYVNDSLAVVYRRFAQLEKDRKNLQTKDFQIGNEKVACSNSLKLWKSITQYYSERGNAIFDKYIQTIPTNTSAGQNWKDTLSDDLNDEIKKTAQRLCQQGCYVSDDVLHSSTIGKLAEAVLSWGEVKLKWREIFETATSHISDVKSDLLRQVDNSVTGLSYGVIGDSIDLLAHSIDDYYARKRQREEALKKAEARFAAAKTSTYSEAERAFSDYMQKTGIPKVKKAVDQLIIALRDVEINALIAIGVLDDSVLKYDVAKSVEVIERAQKSYVGDSAYAVAMALRLFPGNESALLFAVNRNIASIDLVRIMVFLEINNREIIQKLICSPEMKDEDIQYIEDNSEQIFNSKWVPGVYNDAIKERKRIMLQKEKEQQISSLQKRLYGYNSTITEKIEIVYDNQSVDGHKDRLQILINSVKNYLAPRTAEITERAWANRAELTDYIVSTIQIHLMSSMLSTFQS